MGLCNSGGDARQGDIDKSIGFFAPGLFEVLLFLFESACDVVLAYVCDLSFGSSLFRGQAAYLTELLSNQPLSCEILYSKLLESGKIGDLLQVSKGLSTYFFDLLGHLD